MGLGPKPGFPILVQLFLCAVHEVTHLHFKGFQCVNKSPGPQQDSGKTSECGLSPRAGATLGQAIPRGGCSGRCGPDRGRKHTGALLGWAWSSGRAGPALVRAGGRAVASRGGRAPLLGPEQAEKVGAWARVRSSPGPLHWSLGLPLGPPPILLTEGLLKMPTGQHHSMPP